MRKRLEKSVNDMADEDNTEDTDERKSDNEDDDGSEEVLKHKFEEQHWVLTVLTEEDEDDASDVDMGIDLKFLLDFTLPKRARKDDASDVDTDGITVVSGEYPHLRSAYNIIEAFATGSGVVNVVNLEQGWRIEYEDGEVGEVERIHGEYTVKSLSFPERILSGITQAGVLVAFAGIITALASLILATPFSFLESLAVVGGGILIYLVSSVLFVIVPGVTSGERKVDPEEVVPGFEKLPSKDRAALIAMDDTKSGRSVSDYIRSNGTIPKLASMAFWSYIGVLAYLNFSGVGILVFGILLSLSWLLRATLLSSARSFFDPAEESWSYITSIVDYIHERGGNGQRPTTLEYGDVNNPVQENVAAAIPEMNIILLPSSDLKNLPEDEMEAIVAHEYKHVASHYPLVLGFLYAILLWTPGVALILSGVEPTALQVGVGLFVYFAVARGVFALISRVWENQADDFASEVASPLALAFALSRLVPEHTVGNETDSLLANSVPEMYGSHPVPRRRVSELIKRAVEEEVQTEV